jgi:hypothetical protein
VIPPAVSRASNSGRGLGSVLLQVVKMLLLAVFAPIKPAAASSPVLAVLFQIAKSAHFRHWISVLLVTFTGPGGPCGPIGPCVPLGPMGP